MLRRRDRGEWEGRELDRVFLAFMCFCIFCQLVFRGCELRAMHGDIRAIKEAVTSYAPPAEPAEEVPDGE